MLEYELKEKLKLYSILYVEDEEGARETNTRFLQRMFRKVFVAGNGKIAFDLYKAHKPDIILTDIKMPTLDGISMVKQIRSNDKQTKIIILSALSEEKILLESIELGLEKYIIKPITRRNLLPALQKAIDSMEEKQKIFLTKDCYFDKRSAILYNHRIAIELTHKERLLCELLINNSYRIVTYEEIENHIWKGAYMSKDTLRTSVGFLRKKLPKNCIKNISSLGYQIQLLDLF
mgnify:CR=1 FL=1